jgi:alanyl-tRNA synthetase
MKTNEIAGSSRLLRLEGAPARPLESLVPGNDPDAALHQRGLNQFKDVFLGVEKRPQTPRVTAQRCVRAGGKHNDLENVGYTRATTRSSRCSQLQLRRLLQARCDPLRMGAADGRVRAAEGKALDHRLRDRRRGVRSLDERYRRSKDRCIRIGDKPGGRRFESDNFWQMGDTGPCGPCSEIFYDHGPRSRGPPGSPDAEGDRYIEIWNLVFMQFNRDESGTLHPLPKPSVDTGMGLERLTAVLQHVHSNYEIDLFQALIKAAARETGARTSQSPSLRVIADHIRACASSCATA